ncbi:MAG TPA: hypothetical protein VF057_01490 [Thermoanaerobaculia bacterium]
MNSLKSGCSFAKSAPVSFHQLEEDVEPFLRGQVGVELIVGLLGVFKPAKNSSDPFHGSDFTTRHNQFRAL